MRGVDALAAALADCGDCFYTVPGFPVTDIAEAVGAEIVINEKVALEYALGDSLSGRRAAVIIKNVGLNICADPLVNATTQGLRAGVVVVAGDDTEQVASQNAQDSRYYGEVAQVPVIEPDALTCGEGVAEAFAVSERFSRAAILRITPYLNGADVPEHRVAVRRGTGSTADPALTMRGRTERAVRATAEMFAWAQMSRLNRLTGGAAGVGMAPGDSRVRVPYPPPALAGDVTEVREYGRPFVSEHRRLTPPFSHTSEPETMEMRGYHRTFCRGCPFKPVMATLREQGMEVICDIGCSLLAMNPPYSIGIATYGLGSSIAVAAKSTGIALTGDYAVLHTGINALIDVYQKQTPLLCIILKNNRMGMTGGQPVPDLLRYIRWAEPAVCSGSDQESLDRLLVRPETPVTVVIEGECQEDDLHETMEY